MEERSVEARKVLGSTPREGTGDETTVIVYEYNIDRIIHIRFVSIVDK